MGESASGMLSIPIRVSVEGQSSTREEFLRLLKEDEPVRQAVRSLLEDNSVQEASLTLQSPQKEAAMEKTVLSQQSTYFAHGLELFQKYGKLNETIRDQFAHVFQHDDDFETFICCGAQKDAPQEVWDGIKRCLGTAHPRELTVLKNILAYSVELVNRSFPSPIFQLAKVQAGDSYNDNLHSIYGTNSKKQGDVAEVFLQGLLRGNDCIRKSLIRLE